MALDALSGAVYYDTIKNVPKQKAETGAQEGVSNITITEVPVMTKSGSDSQTGSGQNQNAVKGDQIKQAIQQANNKMRAHWTRCEFSYHEETNRVSIKIFDRDTKELIREIPPEETLEMIEKMWELAGLLVDEKR